MGPYHCSIVARRQERLGLEQLAAPKLGPVCFSVQVRDPQAAGAYQACQGHYRNRSREKVR
jgi:hypothetical protein